MCGRQYPSTRLFSSLVQDVRYFVSAGDGTSSRRLQVPGRLDGRVPLNAMTAQPRARHIVRGERVGTGSWQRKWRETADR